MKLSYSIQRGALDGVEAFVRVAERRSFRQAAADLGVTPSAVSQAVRVLEARMGVALFTRTTRSVGLTEAGEGFLARALPAFEEIVAATSAASGLGAKPSGLLRLAVPRAVVPLVLQPMLASFCAAHPDIVVEISASEQLVDVANEGFEAGIRLGEFVAGDMVAVRLTPPFRWVVVGSRPYFRRRGRPGVPADLVSHACIRRRLSDGAIAQWRVRGEDGPGRQPSTAMCSSSAVGVATSSSCCGSTAKGLMLLVKRLERGCFVWPQGVDGRGVLSAAQLSMLLKGIDWRMPARTSSPQLAA